MLGAVPARYAALSRENALQGYFAMARGSQRGNVPALEMTKWFDTNYHYMVPEIAPDQQFGSPGARCWTITRKRERRASRPSRCSWALSTFLSLAKGTEGSVDPLSRLDAVLPVYEEVLRQLASRGASWVQVDEPILVTDLSPAQKDALTARVRAACGSRAKSPSC